MSLKQTKMKSFKEILCEGAETNKFGYNKLQWFVIRQWGSILYMDYDNLPSGSGDIKRFKYYVDEYIDLCNKGDDEEIYEFDDWVQEGMSENGKKILTKGLFDKVIKSAQTSIKEPLIVYKSGNKNSKQNRWISTTTLSGAYTDLGKEEKYVLPKGTNVIFADGIADGNEVIIHSKELEKAKQNKEEPIEVLKGKTLSFEILKVRKYDVDVRVKETGLKQVIPRHVLGILMNKGK